MQNSIFKISVPVFFILILSLSAMAQQQSGLESYYDKFKDATIIYGRRVALVDDIARISIQPAASHQGQKPSEQDTGKKYYLLFSYLSLSNSREDRQRYEGKDLVILSDSGERISGKLSYSKEEATKHVGIDGKEVPGFSIYIYFLRVDFDQLKKLSEAKSAEVRWYAAGGRSKDYSLSSSAISSVKEVVDYFKK